VAAYRETADWGVVKVEGYNNALSGKIMIPQPFGELKNPYEPASGFCISKFMVVEVVVALLIGWLFIGLTNRLQKSGAPRGRLANMLEAILFFFRDEVARKAIGEKEGDKFVPLLWTIFLFVLGCNLMGMVPWVGAPTASFAVTLGLAAVVLGTGIVMGSRKFGLVGYWTNQVPAMDLPWYMAVILKPMLFFLEVGGMIIKHGVLGVRLLANMVAGHIVLLGIMMLAFSVEGALSPSWWIAAPIALVGSTLFSCLELFVAFLQAYIFTFLSALFIGAAVHHH
jgi:F-type H+-transporting ATPase subunit a